MLVIYEYIQQYIHIYVYITWKEREKLNKRECLLKHLVAGHNYSLNPSNMKYCDYS